MSNECGTFLVCIGRRHLTRDEVQRALEIAMSHKYGIDFDVYGFQDSVPDSVIVAEVPGGFQVNVKSREVVDLPDDPGAYTYRQMQINYKT